MAICTICIEPLNSKPTVNLPCNHCFHFVCLVTWFSTRNSCPLCRAVVDLPNRNLRNCSQCNTSITNDSLEVVISPTESIHFECAEWRFGQFVRNFESSENNEATIQELLHDSDDDMNNGPPSPILMNNEELPNNGYLQSPTFVNDEPANYSPTSPAFVYNDEPANYSPTSPEFMNNDEQINPPLSPEIIIINEPNNEHSPSSPDFVNNDEQIDPPSSPEVVIIDVINQQN